MVSISDIHLNNTSLQTPGSGPTVALLGATAGIGLSTLHAILKNTSTPTVYIVGRNPSRLRDLISTAQKLNASATLIPIETGDLTLVKNAEKAAQEIASKASRLDLLVMSPGYLSFASAPDFSPEGLDRITSIRYHARMRFLLTVLPLLRAAPNPRVISILAGGQEGDLKLEDLAMTQKTTYGPLYAAGAAGAMTTLFLEEVAKQEGNEKIVFLHIFPGLVATDLQVRDSGWFYHMLWEWIAKPLFKIFGASAEDAGERVLFAGTNGRFRRVQDPESVRGTLVQEGSDGVLGSGVYAVKEDSEVVKEGGNKELKALKEKGAGRKVWEYTVGEFERIQRL
ncbi:hypothetical protein H2200_005123 [Cladophialophora chaetospira]|uniref:NAD(P)-binding protein n=1 Tax=Cladophialophora chaetospira TaxID=386627 RepID=A0AA38XBZ8_9EURO|nr:hypothetical protein H2200_005123 [Cladophialophora chaetospira]